MSIHTLQDLCYAYAVADPVREMLFALQDRIDALEAQKLQDRNAMDAMKLANEQWTVQCRQLEKQLVAQRKPLTDEQVNECGMCGYVGKDKDKTGQCPNCRWDELRPLTGKAHQKPLTDDQIYEMYNEPRSDAEMLEFARAIEAAHNIKEGT